MFSQKYMQRFLSATERLLKASRTDIWQEAALNVIDNTITSSTNFRPSLIEFKMLLSLIRRIQEIQAEVLENIKRHFVADRDSRKNKTIIFFGKARSKLLHLKELLMQNIASDGKQPLAGEAAMKTSADAESKHTSVI